MDFDSDQESLIPRQQTHIKIDTTGALWVPLGTTGQRPGSPSQGFIRFNSDLDVTEWWDGAAWVTAVLKSGDKMTGSLGIGVTGTVEQLLHILGATPKILVEGTSTAQYTGSAILLENGATSNKRGASFGSFIRDADASDSYFAIDGLDSSNTYEKTLARYNLSDDYWDFNTANTIRLTINPQGAIGFSTAYGAVGQALVSQGDAAPPVWAQPSVIKSLTASENLAAGDWVNIHDSTGVKVRKANATSAGKEVNGFVLAAVTSGNPALVYVNGINSQVSGQTIGSVFLQTTGGAGGSTVPSTTGNVVQRIGTAVSATEVIYERSPPITLA